MDFIGSGTSENLFSGESSKAMASGPLEEDGPAFFIYRESYGIREKDWSAEEWTRSPPPISPPIRPSNRGRGLPPPERSPRKKSFLNISTSSHFATALSVANVVSHPKLHRLLLSSMPSPGSRFNPKNNLPNLPLKL